MKIVPLSEGSFTIDQTKVFVPFDTDKDILNERPRGSLLVEIQPFVVQTATDTILIDTGLGFSYNETMQLHSNLKSNNIDPASVTKVLLSHLHKDHAGGISWMNNEREELSFSNATYYVHEKEIAFALEKGMPSYDIKDFEILINNLQLQIFTGESGNINAQIYYDVCGGHCPYHTVFKIVEDDQIIFYGGDVAPQLEQMKRKIMAKYDFDGRKSMELRLKWLEMGEKEGWTFLFFHDIKTPFFKFSV